jgi:O-antigen biosynthesis protein WbqP
MSKELLRREQVHPTRLGSWLRRFSLDELPQLINVVRGDMSLVGPRPALYTQTDLTEMRARSGALRVKPGITGLAQVSGREDLDLAVKVGLDAEYVGRLSLWLDIQIICRTFAAVVRARGNY